MSWDKWHRDPREGEVPEEPRSTPAHPLGRELSAAEMAAELRRIFAKMLARIERERQTGAKS